MLPTPDSPSNTILKFVLISLVIIAVPIGLTATNFIGRSALWENAHWTLATWCMTFLGYLGWRTASGDIRRIRGIMTLGLLSYSIGQILWDVQWAIGYTAFPAPSDIFYLGIAPFLTIGLISTFRNRVSRSDELVLYLDGAIIFVGLATAIFALYGPRASSLSVLVTVVLVAYPVVFLASGGAGLVGALATRAQFRAFNAPYILLIGFGISGVCWVIWDSLTLDQINPPGTLVAYGFSLAHLVVGLGVGVWDSIPSASPRFHRWAKLSLRLLPIIIIPLTVVVMVSSGTHPTTLRVPTEIGGAIVIILAVIRQTILLWERESLLTREREALQNAGQEIAERKQAEEALRQSEQRFRMVLDNLGEGVAVQDTDWRYTYANPAAHAIVGWEPGTLIGASEDEIIAPTSRLQVKQRDAIRSQGQISSYETELIRPNGEIRTIIASGVPRLDGQGKLVETFVTFTDITERKRADEELRRSEEKFRQLITSAPDAIIGANQEGKIIFASVEATTLLGYELEELMSMNIEALMPARFRAAHTAKYTGYMTNPHPRMRAGLELFARRKDGSEVPVDINLSRLDTEAGSLVTAFIRDITVRKQAEEALRESEERYRLISTLSTEYVFSNTVYRDETITYDWQSGAFESITGYTLEEIQRIGLRTIIHPDDLEINNHFLEKLKLNQKVSGELRLITKSGEIRWLREYLHPVWDETENRLTGIYGAVQDITERKRAEEEIQLLNAKLEHRVKERTAQLNEANQNLHQEKVRLEQYSRQRELMGTMTDLLQASLSTDEASSIVSRYVQLLFPNRDGALYLLNASAMLEPIAIWGEQKSLDTVFGMNECWALRRGKTYRFGSGSPNPPCVHVGEEITQSALCIPLSAQGENIGSLHISTENIGEGGLIDDEEQRFIETIADSIALALANLRLRERLREQTIRDPLTGIFNRRFMEETLEREVHRAGRNQEPLCVLMFEVDDFKRYNNTFGHDAGDYVLKKVTDTMHARLRRSDFPCRYGGDEFTLLLPNTTLEDGAHRAEELRKAVEALALSYNNQALGLVTVRMGVAVYPKHGETGEAVLKAADDASYQARAIGKNCVVVAD